MKIAFLLFIGLAGWAFGQASTSASKSKRAPPSTTEQQKNSEEAARQLTQSLYNTLRNVALPQSPLSDAHALENRFLLLMPGKVLNYYHLSR